MKTREIYNYKNMYNMFLLFMFYDISQKLASIYNHYPQCHKYRYNNDLYTYTKFQQKYEK